VGELALILSAISLFALIFLTVFLVRQQQGGDKQFNQAAQQLLDQLAMQRDSQERLSGTMHQRLDTTGTVLREVSSKLAQLEEGQRHLGRIGDSVRELEHVLRAPKVRGTMGELWLGELLAQIVPQDHYKLQYTFSTGETVDAVVRLANDLLVPIDAKFPLEHFMKAYRLEDEREQVMNLKLFTADVKKHIDDIARKYIKPASNTLNVAFMYIPAENVYYQAFLEDQDLLQYAFRKNVVPVSPSSLFAYLNVVLLGLRGMQVERQAQDILRTLSQVSGDVNRFRDQFEKVGSHLKNAQGAYEMSDKRLGMLSVKVDQLVLPDETPNLE